MKINELISNVGVWVTNDEEKLLNKIKSPRLLSSFNSHDRFKLETMIRKDLVIKRGFENPVVIVNEKLKKHN